ncbi:MAG: cyclodeaminase/cyclohydrolase family protein [Clostridiales bacterium]|uniref:cyclodeaminase/cyclohydrolase family protein n=1 Tax=Clostridium sp. N3C TaxID=1776758 RepID=UPI00092DF565|nr:cyclodeaminase/cyclohydrolase family protein [Clostridium sp. N3C]NLZ48456.1 cyclodeaminase/cyclohydrolase family protein [Clostridiales bacterium]SCN21469.1 Methenyltetrahydrofolate cyclohydrolase [Clostridium sp. N3C]
MGFEKDQISDFLAKLASSSAVPGGGGAAALASALSAALNSMVFNLTIGKKGYDNLNKEEQENVEKALEYSTLKLQDFQKFINKDGEAFSTLMESYRLPKNSDEEKEHRRKMISEGLYNAMMVPYSLMKETVELMEHILTAAKFGNSNVISDAGVSAMLAYSAVESCMLNVMINYKALKDEKYKEVENESIALVFKAENLKNEIMNIVYEKIMGYKKN